MFYGLNENSRKTMLSALEQIGSVYGRVFRADHLITIERCMGFFDDEPFMQAYRKHVTDAQEESLIWRLHTLAWAGKHCLHVPGDFVECGVYKGFSAAVLVDYLHFGSVDKSYYLYDTFDGVPESLKAGTTAGPDAYRLPELHKFVERRFEAFKNVRLVPGALPESLEQESPERISLLHLDLNSAQAEVGVLERVFDSISPGGMIVFDDYGWQGYRDQKEAEDAYVAGRQHAILELPTGQGLLVKH